MDISAAASPRPPTLVRPPGARGPLPDDAALPGLRAIVDGRLDDLLAAGGMARTAEPALLKHRPGVRATLLLATDSGPAAVKVLDRDGVDRALALHAALAPAGLASGAGPTIPPLLAADRRLGVVVTRWLEGPSTVELLAASEGRRAGDLASTWLRAVAERAAPLGAPYGPDDVLAEGEQWVQTLDRATAGALAAPAAQRLRELDARRPRDRPEVLGHGSFKPQHVVDLGGTPGVLDWDGYRRGPLEADAAMFLAALAQLATGRDLGSQRAAAAGALVDGVADLVDRDALAWYTAAFVVRLAVHLVVRRPRHWPERAADLLADPAAGLRR